jgi:hypothetical protein
MLQVPTDTTWVAVTQSVEQDTVQVDVEVVIHHEPMLDSVALRELREISAADAESQIAHYLATCGCVESAGPPDLFWYGLLALGVYAVRKLSDDGMTINITNGAEATASSEGGDGGDADADADARIEPPDDCYPGR